MDAVRRHRTHGREPLLVVPTRADAEHYLRELAGDGAAMGVRVERFAGLIGEAVARAGVGSPLLAGSARQRTLQALAQRAGAPSSPGFVRALGDLFAELQVLRVTPPRLSQALTRLGATDGPGTTLARLGELFADYCATLKRIRRMDAEQRAVRALDALRERPALWADTPVLFYGFDDLTRLQLDAIETLGSVLEADVTVSLAYEPGRFAFAGRAAGFHALAPLALEHIQLHPRDEHYAPHARAALSHLERSLFEPQAQRVEADAAVRLLEGGGERAELELVAGEIVALLGAGVAAEEVAVLVRASAGATDLDLLEEVFASRGIPFALRRTRSFSDTALGRALIGALRCVPARDGSCRGELSDLLAWLRAPGVLGPHGEDARPSLADRLEIAARRAGMTGAVEARALWEERNWPLESLERLAQAQASGAAALCDRAARELQWLFSAPRRHRAQVLTSGELEDAHALSAGRRALAELRELAGIDAQLAPASAMELADTLEQVQVIAGEHARDGAVAVLDPLALRARRVRALFVCGLQEGVFPARALARPLLSEEQRRQLAEVSGLRLAASISDDDASPEGEHAHAVTSEDALAAERYLLYAAVSRPQEVLFLSWHVADDDGEASSRSLFVDDVCDLFEPSLSRRRARRPLGTSDGVPAEAARRARPPAERTLRDELLLAQLREHIWSPSSLERWIGCPTAWFVERMLRPDAFDPDPEPLARGALAHAVLRDTLQALREDTGSARLSAANLPRARELLAAALADNEAAHPLSTVPERRTALLRRLRADLQRYLAHAAACESPLEPYALELGFGFAQDDERGEASELPAVDLGDGVWLRGRIDRVDVGAGGASSPQGEAVVYDYKGGRAPAGARWVRDGSVQVALYMRAVEQLLGLRVVGGFYQPLTGEDLRARGVLDGDAGLELDCVRSDVYEHDELRELLAQTLASAREAADEAGRGELQARPHTCAYGGGCLYPSICRSER